MRFTQRKGVLLVGLVAAVCMLHGPFSNRVRAERLPIKTYTVADGLLRDSVFRIRQDSRGFMWFCSVDGISRFDGQGFTNFTTDDGLPDRHVNDIVETSDGTFLIATDSGIAKLNPRGIRGNSNNPLFSVLLPADQQAYAIETLLQDNDGTIWAGTSNGLYRLVFRGGSLEHEPVDIGLTGPPDRIRALLKDSQNFLWVGTQSHGLFRLRPDGSVENYPVYVTSMMEDKDGRLWAAMNIDWPGPRGLSLLDRNAAPGDNIVLRNYTEKDGLMNDRVSALYQASDGRILVGTTAGLCSWQAEGSPSVCKAYVAKNGVCDSEIWSISEDRDANLWVGTRCGTKKISRFGFSSYFKADGLVADAVNSIFEDRNGEMFVSFNQNNRQVSRFDGERFASAAPQLPQGIGFGWGWNQTVLHDSVGDWWFPTKKGVYRITGPSFESVGRGKPEKVLFDDKDVEIFRLFEDSRGDIWFATTGPNELWRWERRTDQWHDHTQVAGFSLQRLGTAFAEDELGNVWIAASQDDVALIRYRDGNFRVFSHAEGMPKGWTRALHFDRLGRLWLANGTVGLLRLEDAEAEHLAFDKFTTADGLASNGIYCITEDEFGRIYTGTGRGVDRIDPETRQVVNFTTADGLPDSTVESAFRDRHNALWFATSNGLARFVPEPGRPRTPPAILITGLRIAGRQQPVSILGETDLPPVDLASTDNQVEVDFVGLGANLGEKLRYEYRLASHDWTPTVERTLNFANLGAGDYRFEVRAITADRIYSAAPATLSFRIPAPIWQRWWFILSVVVLAALAIYFFYWYRLKQLIEIERARTRIATDLHDDIGSNLSKISLLSEVVKLQPKSSNGERDRMLDSIAEISRESTQAMSDIVWAISPRRDSMLELTRRMREHAEGIFVERGVRLSFKAPPDGERIKLSMNTRRELYLIFKEALNNVVKHSGCGECEIDFRIVDKALFLEIRDDGRGFDIAQYSDGNGLENMRNRAVAAGGKFDVASEVDRGTTVNVRFPLQ